MRTLSLLLAFCVLAVVPPAARADDAPAEKPKTVNLVLREVDVVTAIQQLASMAGANVIVSPKIKGRVTMDFNNTPFRKALEQVAKACGGVVEEKDYGIYMVVPKEALPEKTYTHLYKRVLSRGKTVRGRVERAQVLQVHDVRDLAQSNVDLLLLTGQGHDKEVSKVTLREGAGTLSVMATPAAQKRVSKRLEELRKRLSAGELFDQITVAGKTMYLSRIVKKFNKGGDRLVSVDGSGVRGRVVDKAGVPQLRARVVSRFNKRGQIELYVEPHVEVTAKAEALQRQAEQLKKAGVLLKSAGDKAGAERAFARAKQAYASARAAVQEAKKAREVAKAARTQFEVHRATQVGSVASIEKLRHEVRALRGEVRELTGLVRRLLEK